jgi:hypothetical protein
MSRTTGGMINFFNYIIMSTVPPNMAATLARAVNIEQEDHDGPEVAHLYIGPPSPPPAGPILTQGLLFEQMW